jgi:glycosyltransferase involved in cell wall biosynthesis
MSLAPAYPLVSVIIPAYNAQAYIAQALHSVLNQTYKNIEVLVVDDGSQDQTSEIVQLIARDDHRVILLKQSNQGAAAARNFAISKSTGAYIAPLDADDTWFPKALEKLLNCLRREKSSVGVAYAWSVYIDEAGRITGGYKASRIDGDVYHTLLAHNFLGNASCCLIRRVCLESVGVYDRQFRACYAQGCEDWDLYLRIAEHYQFRVVPKFLVGYRKTFSGLTSDCSRMARSHRLLLDKVSQKRLYIPGVIYRLSTSQFYMYLAFESGRRCRHSHVLYWVRRAIRTNPITPFLRCGLYVLLMRSILSMIMPSVFPVYWPRHLWWFTPKPPARDITLSDFQKQSFRIKGQLLIQDIFHFVIQKIVLITSSVTVVNR